MVTEMSVKAEVWGTSVRQIVSGDKIVLAADNRIDLYIHEYMNIYMNHE